MFSDRELELIHLSVSKQFLVENAKSKAYPLNIRDEKTKLAKELRELMNKVNSLIMRKE